MHGYNHRKIEQKWQKEWEKRGLYKTPDKAKGRDNFYLLTEFPYPSGNLHVGHWYAFSVPDILARALRMQGKNVLYPIGFDAFGLPAENAAIKHKLNPRKWTYDNIAYMKKQIRSMGASFDWSREVITCDPAYYKWTQWQFLQFFKNGLAYQKETAVNWCPKDKTVLANEQVIEGKCERCDTEVVQKHMLQWNLKITDYADRLIKDLEGLNWPEPIKEAQRSWIGRSEGAEIDFPLVFEKQDRPKQHYVFLHGYKGSPQGSFHQWLKRELENRGHRVEVPELPNPNTPKESEQIQKVIESCEINENTIIVGHSLGGMVAMKVVEKLNRPIAGLVLVGSAINAKFPGATERSYWKDFNWDVNYEKIKKLVGFSVILSDLQEGFPRVPYLKDLASKLGARLVEGNANEKHFIGKEEPMVLKSILPHITVFTTRPDTLFGGTYLVLAPEHPWLIQLLASSFELLKNAEEVKKYVEHARKKTELERQESKEKTGVELKGVKAINPATKEEIPIWVADYVLSHYGTGAIMAVPAHDERDFDFAAKYGLPMVEVVEPLIVRTNGHDAVRSDKTTFDRTAVMVVVKHWVEDKYLCLEWQKTDLRGFVCGGIENEETPEEAAAREIREETGYKNIRFIRRLGGTVHSRFYHAHRGENKYAHFTPILMQLENGEYEEPNQRERELHKAVWVETGKLKSFINREDMALVWQRVAKPGAYAGGGILAHSSEFNGMNAGDAGKAIVKKYGCSKVTYKLRDWIVSRQRYWGVPIPIIHCEKCGAQAVPDKDLPVKLPEVKGYLPDGRGKSPLAKAKKWVAVKCPKCKGDAERETDTLDTFVDSSWYFLRYADPKNKKKFADARKMANWMPVELYSGGAEHTTMHVLYSRFWHKTLFDLGLVKDTEPYTRRMNRSLILGPDGQKMSKSRGNVVDPDEVVKRLGADTVRMYLAFIGPYNEVSSYPWNPDGVVGVRRFLERVWRIGQKIQARSSKLETLEPLLHKTIKKAGEDIAALKFNTAISALMIFLNAVEKESRVGKDQWNVFLRLLAPFAPHIAEELWERTGNKKSVHLSKWPLYDPSKLKEEVITIAVQVNGKTRGEAQVLSDADKAAIEKAALEAVASHLERKRIVRTIVVPNRLVNFVVK